MRRPKKALIQRIRKKRRNLNQLMIKLLSKRKETSLKERKRRNRLKIQKRKRRKSPQKN